MVFFFIWTWEVIWGTWLPGYLVTCFFLSWKGCIWKWPGGSKTAHFHGDFHGDIAHPFSIIYWLLVWLPFGLFSHWYWECHHPNWRTHIFQRGGLTTNQFSYFGLHLAFEKNHQESPRFAAQICKRLDHAGTPSTRIAFGGARRWTHPIHPEVKAFCWCVAGGEIDDWWLLRGKYDNTSSIHDCLVMTWFSRFLACSCLVGDVGTFVSGINICGGFLSHVGTANSSSICRWDFPWDKPSSYLGLTPMTS